MSSFQSYLRILFQCPHVLFLQIPVLHNSLSLAYLGHKSVTWSTVFIWLRALHVPVGCFLMRCRNEFNLMCPGLILLIRHCSLLLFLSDLSISASESWFYSIRKLFCFAYWYCHLSHQRPCRPLWQLLWERTAEWGCMTTPEKQKTEALCRWSSEPPKKPLILSVLDLQLNIIPH